MTEFLNFSHFSSLVTLDHLYLYYEAKNRGNLADNSLIRHGRKHIRHKAYDIRFWNLCAVTEKKFVLGSDADW